MNRPKRETLASTLLLVSADGHRYLCQTQERHERIYKRKIGRTTIVRGMLDGFAQAGFDLAAAGPTEFDIANLVRTLLSQRTEVIQ